MSPTDDPATTAEGGAPPWRRERAEAELAQVMAGSGDPVARVELYHFAAPLPAVFRPSWLPGFPQRDNRCTILRVVTRDGVEGWSAGPAVGRERRGLGDLVGPYLIGEDATDLHLVQQRLREMSYLGWRNWWIEPAFWDIKGRRAGMPAWRLLGGADPGPLAVYASTGEVKSGPDRIREAAARYAEGFRTIKIRVHQHEEADLDQLTQVVLAVGDRMSVAVDANQGWRVTLVADAPRWDLPRARRFAEVCADLGVAWLEEPLPMDAYDDLVALTAAARVPIAGGELHTQGEPELAMMIDRGCYRIFQPDAVFTGGIAQTLRVAWRCRERGLGYSPHTWTNGLGLAVNLQVLVASGMAGRLPLEYPYAPPGWIPAARDAMLESALRHERGFLRVPQGPGLGVRIDRGALRRFGERFFVMDRIRQAFFALRDRGPRVALELARARRERQRPSRG